MAGRPRTSAAILRLRGAFKNHPERAREDLPGAGPWDDTPPEYLTGEERAAWREVITWLPKVALTLTERLGVTVMAQLWAQAKATNKASPDYVRLLAELRQWSGQMGMTLQARTKLGTSDKQKGSSKYQGIKEGQASPSAGDDTAASEPA